MSIEHYGHQVALDEFDECWDLVCDGGCGMRVKLQGDPREVRIDLEPAGWLCRLVSVPAQMKPCYRCNVGSGVFAGCCLACWEAMWNSTSESGMWRPEPTLEVFVDLDVCPGCLPALRWLAIESGHDCA